MKSILVIGGGLVGAACALRLQAAGVQVTLIDPGDKRRGASYGNAGHIGSEQVAPWSAWGNVLRAPRSSFGAGGPLDFRWSDVALWTPWAMRFLRACDPLQFERGREALDNLLADSLPSWQRIAELAQAPEIVIPHGHVTAWMTARGAETGLAAVAAAKDAAGQVTTATMLRAAAGIPHVAHNSGENEWYTPPYIIELARSAMGGIDTDPATSEIANRTVGASLIYTIDDDGRSKKWEGRVWMNPPYAQPLVGDFAEAATAKYASGEYEQACILVNNATETRWFCRMLEEASAVCFPRSRIRFLGPQGNPGAPLQGQAVVYLGRRVREFVCAFSTIGFVLVRP